MDCVILAAGKSERMGRWKMTLPFGGSTIIEETVYTVLNICSRVLLVAGYNRNEIIHLFHRDDRVEVVYNENYESGMFSSIQAGCSRVETERFFLTLGDMPLVLEDTYTELLNCPETAAVIPKYRGKKGHPVLMTKSVADAIAGFDPSKTMREVLAAVPTLLVPVEDGNVLLDVDTEEDYQRVENTKKGVI